MKRVNMLSPNCPICDAENRLTWLQDNKKIVFALRCEKCEWVQKKSFQKACFNNLKMV